MSRSKCPSFLTNFSSVYAHSENEAPFNGTFVHNATPYIASTPAECLYWPPVSRSPSTSSSLTPSESGLATLDETDPPTPQPNIPDGPVTILIFIPGNPGLVSFYTRFLKTIHERVLSGADIVDGNGVSSASSVLSTRFGILGHAHLGHAPNLKGNEGVKVDATRLVSQVEALVEVVDAVRKEWEGCKVVLAGHSVGAWLATQVMKHRPDDIDAAFLLFPTLSNIADTPNGKSLWWLFRWPVPQVLSFFASLASALLPRLWLLSLLSYLFADWPLLQIIALRSLVRSPHTVRAVLRMAGDEMKTIRALDEADVLGSVSDVLRKNGARVWAYFGEEGTDDWVGANDQVGIIEALKNNDKEDNEPALNVLAKVEEDGYQERIILCEDDIPHAFCINHDELMGKRVSEWLFDGKLVNFE